MMSVFLLDLFILPLLDFYLQTSWLKCNIIGCTRKSIQYNTIQSNRHSLLASRSALGFERARNRSVLGRSHSHLISLYCGMDCQSLMCLRSIWRFSKICTAIPQVGFGHMIGVRHFRRLQLSVTDLSCILISVQLCPKGCTTKCFVWLVRKKWDSSHLTKRQYLPDESEAVQHTLDRLTIEKSSYDICLLPPKCCMILQD